MAVKRYDPLVADQEDILFIFSSMDNHKRLLAAKSPITGAV